MSLRRTVEWLCAALLAPVALPVVTATPAAAAAPAEADYSVRLQGMPSGYLTGGSAGGLTVQVAAKRKAGCVRVRRALTVRLGGLAANEVRVQRAVAGAWLSLPVAATDDGVRVADAAADPGSLCRNRTSSVRYRIAFLRTAPAGRATFIAEAFNPKGLSLGRDSTTRRVIKAPAATASPTPTPTPTAAPEPSPSLIVGPDETTAVAGASARALEGASGGSGPGLGGMVIVIGLLMVGIGLVLLVLVLRNNRRGPEGGDPTLALPTLRQ